MHYDLSHVFTMNRYFKGIYSLPIKDDLKSYLVLPMQVIYAIKQPFRKELERLQEQHILE